jgi:GT2 family glycosyltransferase
MRNRNATSRSIMPLQTPTSPHLAVLIATRNRVASLQALLESIDMSRQRAAAGVQVVVADNGSSDETPELLRRWAAGGEGRDAVRVDLPGKSRALNTAISRAQAPLLAFVDDDETVAPDWIAGILRFCAAHPGYAAASGRVLPPEAADAELLERVAWYRTIAFFDGGPAVRDLDTLYGGNMVVRRTAFDQVGCFDERLGPGGIGGWEDIDLARRLGAAGLRIGYMPEVAVHHAIDPTRLTPQYFRHHQTVAARSAFAIDPNGSTRNSALKLIEASFAFVWWSLLGRARRREHARGRMIRHRELVRLRWGGG